MARRRKRAETAMMGKDTFHVLDSEGRELARTGYSAKVGLIQAQEKAQRAFDAPVTLTVQRRSLFGPAAQIFRVVRDEDGNVLTFTLDAQD